MFGIRSKKLENIFLMRHGNSEANRDLSLYRMVPDHAIGLTPDGMSQAEAGGRAFGSFIGGGDPRILPGAARLWCSPYVRTIQTRDGFLRGFDRPGFFRDMREDILLTEQRFGLFDGLTDDECAEKYPDEFHKFELCKKYQGKFYAQPPNGESRFDVSVRTRQFFGTIIRDAEKPSGGVPNVFIISHGTSIRAFTMMWLHLDVEWFEKEPNPGNASIRHIGRGEDGRWKDFGYIFEGVPDQEAARKSQKAE